MHALILWKKKKRLGRKTEGSSYKQQTPPPPEKKKTNNNNNTITTTAKQSKKCAQTIFEHLKKNKKNLHKRILEWTPISAAKKFSKSEKNPLNKRVQRINMQFERSKTENKTKQNKQQQKKRLNLWNKIQTVLHKDGN